MLRFFTSTVALITTSLLLLTACSREGDKVYVRTLYAPIQQAANSASSPSAHAGYAYFGEALELVGQSTNPSMLSVKASRNGAQGLVHRALVTKLPAEIDMLRSAGAAPSVVLVATPPRDTNSQLEVTIPIGLVTADLDGRLKLKLKAGDTVVLQGGPFKASTLTEVFGSEVAATELDTLQIFDGQKFVQPGKTGPALPSKTDVAPVSVNAMYEYSLPSLPLIVAVKKDLFKRRGVNVTLQGLKGRSRLAIEQTEILHGHGLYVMELAGAKPQEFRCVHPYGVTKSGPAVRELLVRKDANIKTWADLAAVETEISSSTDYETLQKVFAANGIPQAKIPTRYLLGSEDAKARYHWADSAANLKTKHPGAYTTFATNLEAQIADPYFFGCSYMQMGAYAAKTQAMQAYIAAIDEAIDLIRKDPRGSIAFLAEYFPEEEGDIASMQPFTYTKSTELIDFNALQKQRGKDLREFLY